MKNVIMKSLGGLVIAAAFPLTAQAAICTASSDITNPDPSVTNATLCGEGTFNTPNESIADLFTETGFTWSLVDKDDKTGDGAAGALLTTNVPNGISGAWAFDAQTGFTDYLLVIKDGKVPDGNTNPNISWFWFIVDLGAGCDRLTQSTYTTQNYCGSWAMYGENGSAKGISHMSLYARNGGGGGGGGSVPEPGVLFLMGAGLLGLGMARRRKSA